MHNDTLPPSSPSEDSVFVIAGSLILSYRFQAEYMIILLVRSVILPALGGRSLDDGAGEIGE